jgi:hypothetical protein
VLSGVAGTPGDEPVPDHRPAFVATDLGAIAPEIAAVFARAS